MRLLTIAALLLASSLALAAPSLLGQWRIVAIAGVEKVDMARTRADFAQNGRYASTIGCNRIAGKAIVSSDRLSFGPMMTTRMACPDPLDRVERAYLAALQAVRGYRFEGGKLALVGEDGAALVTLVRLR
jgi:heat shock protein HslJ